MLNSLNLAFSICKRIKQHHISELSTKVIQCLHCKTPITDCICKPKQLKSSEPIDIPNNKKTINKNKKKKELSELEHWRRWYP